MSERALVWVPDKNWVMAEGRRCRMHACGQPSVAKLKRGRSGWWHYCERHLYGRRIKHGVVEVMVHPDSPTARAASTGNAP